MIFFCILKSINKAQLVRFKEILNENESSYIIFKVYSLYSVHTKNEHNTTKRIL
jgi:hypothetical protein